MLGAAKRHELLRSITEALSDTLIGPAMLAVIMSPELFKALAQIKSPLLVEELFNGKAIARRRADILGQASFLDECG